MTNEFSLARARAVQAGDQDILRNGAGVLSAVERRTRGAGVVTDSRDQPVPRRRCGRKLVAIPGAPSPIIVSGLSLVNADRTSLDISAVQFLYRRLRSFIGGHLNETKPSRAISRSIDYDLGAVDFTCF